MIFFRTLCVLTAAVSGALSQTEAPAPPPVPSSAWPFGRLQASGLVDGYYSLNFNHPISHANQYRNFDVRADRISVNMARLTLERSPEPLGFRADFGVGRAFEVVHATEPAGDVLDWLPQAYVSLKPTKDRGLQVDFGKFFTSAGAELTETHLNWNYSRSLLYANGPYYHLGVRLTRPLAGSFTVGLQAVNGWNNIKDNNSGKTLGLTTAWTGSRVSWFNSYYAGPEKDGSNQGIRHFYDTVLTVTPRDTVSAYVNFDYGTEKVDMAGNHVWVGIAGAARFSLTRRIALSPRAEYYSDRDGFITGTPQNLKEVTMTAEYKWREGLLSRFEYRRDWSDREVFERGRNGAFRSQNTLLLGFVAYFGPK